VVLFVSGVVETVTIGWHVWPQLVVPAAFVSAPALALGMFGVRRVRRASAS
jgi:hypothetical protein